MATQDVTRVGPTGMPGSPPRGDEDMGPRPEMPAPARAAGEGELSDIEPQDIGGSLSDDV